MSGKNDAMGLSLKLLVIWMFVSFSPSQPADLLSYPGPLQPGDPLGCQAVTGPHRERL